MSAEPLSRAASPYLRCSATEGSVMPSQQSFESLFDGMLAVKERVFEQGGRSRQVERGRPQILLRFG